jgi:hypothetical protein
VSADRDAGPERRRSWSAPLSSRIGFVHEFRPLGPAEVRALLSGWRPRELSLPTDLLVGAAGVAALIRVTEGDFRLLDRLVW